MKMGIIPIFKKGDSSMTRLIAILSCLVLVLGLCIGVSAADDTRATSVNIIASVSSNSSCDVTTAVTIHVDEPKKELVFPVPAVASNVTLNGKPVLTEKNGQARLVNLSRILGGMSGDFSFSVSYSIHGTVKTLNVGTEEAPQKRLQLELPLLAGFAYPIDDLQFSINLPGNVTQSPSFVSGYHQANIEKDLNYSISGANIAGRNWSTLKDHETLSMYMDVTEEMFPQSRADLPALGKVTPLVGICAALALLFWLLFLRNYLPLHSFPAVAPEGFGAGQMGTILSMEGADLNLMVFSWAQLGYVTLHMDRRGYVFIQKRMDMGNERTLFEQKCFHHLFAYKSIVNTATTAYQRLCQKIRLQRSAQQLFRSRRRLLWIKIFRVITAAAGLLSGTCFGILLGNMLDYGWFFMLVLSAVGLLCSWQIQFWPEGLFLHRRSNLWMAGCLCALWLILGIVIKQFPLALLSVAIQVIAGFLAFFGGRRTEEGRNAIGQVLALRRHLKKLTPHQVHTLCQNNPEFFFDMAPYAIALGCDKVFARRFGNSRLPECPYLQAAGTHGLTAKQWSQQMHHVLNSMSAHRRNSPMDGLRSVMNNYMK